MSHLRLATLVATIGCALLVGSVGTAAAAQTAPQPLAKSVPVTGVAKNGKKLTGTLTIDKFSKRGGKLFADGTLKGKLKGRTVKRAVSVPVSRPTIGTGAATSQLPVDPNACQILNLVLGPINLNLLGLRVRTNQINVIIDAVPGAGNLLGNLLCGITNLLNPNSLASGPLGQLTQILNALLALAPKTAYPRAAPGSPRARRGEPDATTPREPGTLPGAVIIFSGIQPTGTKHLGNYIGAITQYVAGQDRGDPAIYCIVDLHATTVPYEPNVLREATKDLAALLVAAGLDADRCVLFRQSDVQEHTELTWLLSSVTSVGELNRMHQFRDKALNQRERVSAGLLYYPVLMAADVLAYRAHEVPVGEDQREHVELMRTVAESFNRRFGELLVVPEARTPSVGARIRDLQDPARKMSTTGGTPKGTVLVLDPPDTIRKKIRGAATDSGEEIVRRGDKPGISNLIEIMAAARRVAPAAVEREFASSRYGEFKTAVGEAVVDWLAPVQARYPELRADDDELESILEAGAERARTLARETLADVREAMGVGPARRSVGPAA